jgi:site-specific DNA-methyltransferase (adenine-specific)
MRRELEEVLMEAGRRGLLVGTRLYPRADLIRALEAAGMAPDAAADAFLEIRDAAGADTQPGALGIEAVGERRGRKYRLRGLPPPETGAAPILESQAIGVRAPLSPVPTRLPSSSSNPELEVHFGDNLPVLRGFTDASFDLVYIDPPFNTGREQARTRIRTVRDDEEGDRTGFQGKRYRTLKIGTVSFADDFDDFLAFLEPRLVEAYRLLKPQGSFFLHLDYREVHYCKVLLDHLFGRECFKNEIIWAYDYGARSRRVWSAKHDTILWYAKDPERYTFNFDRMDRIPYMAPGLVGAEKAARGKTPTDVWWHTIVPTNGRERTGYPTQKPLGVLNRLIEVHSAPGDQILDFFAGSGTTGEAAVRLGRSCVLVDDSIDAMKVMWERLSFANPRFYGWKPPAEAELHLATVGTGVTPQQRLFG